MEMEKKGESQQRGGGVKEMKNEDYGHKILFAAGTALLMACLKRAIVVSFAAQWRWWVFVVLNLVLLAIVFMSMSSTARENQEEINRNVEMTMKTKKQRKQRRKQQCSSRLSEIDDKSDRDSCCHENLKPLMKRSFEVVVESIGTHVEEEDRDNGEEEFLPSLSKEELNERVEAFIVMFKKHLATDAKN